MAEVGEDVVQVDGLTNAHIAQETQSAHPTGVLNENEDSDDPDPQRRKLVNENPLFVVPTADMLDMLRVDNVHARCWHGSCMHALCCAPRTRTRARGCKGRYIFISVLSVDDR